MHVSMCLCLYEAVCKCGFTRFVSMCESLFCICVGLLMSLGVVEEFGCIHVMLLRCEEGTAEGGEFD